MAGEDLAWFSRRTAGCSRLAPCRPSRRLGRESEFAVVGSYVLPLFLRVRRHARRAPRSLNAPSKPGRPRSALRVARAPNGSLTRRIALATVAAMRDEREPAPRILIVVTTVGTQEQALDIANHLVERRLAACVNIVPGVRSIFFGCR